MKRSRLKPPRLPMKKSNPARKKKAHAAAFGPPGFVEFIHAYGCVVAREYHPQPTACLGPIEVAHRKSRGAGGGWRDNTYGCCRYHHAEQHSMGLESFEAHYQLDGDLWAAAYAHQFDLSQ